MRDYSVVDRFLVGLDVGLRTVFGRPPTTGRPSPIREAEPEPELSPGERRLAGRLIRIDHAGEVAAQGLYQGQALTARSPQVRQQMQRASEEENDHLAWCDQRLEALRTHRSRLGPLWYGGAYAIGSLAGLIGDRWSLGFVQETERQVVAHLDDHLHRIPAQDARSRAVLEQMKADEARHAAAAGRAGAAELPAPVKGIMRLASKVMTGTASWI